MTQKTNSNSRNFCGKWKSFWKRTKTKTKFINLKQAPASMSPAHLQQYASSGQLSESLPSSQVNVSWFFCLCLFAFNWKLLNCSAKFNQTKIQLKFDVKNPRFGFVCGAMKARAPDERTERGRKWVCFFAIFIYVSASSHDDKDWTGIEWKLKRLNWVLFAGAWKRRRQATRRLSDLCMNLSCQVEWNEALKCLLFSLQQLQIAHMNADMNRDDMHGLSVSGGESSSGGGASPLTARSIRLERFAQALANSQEELRRWVSLWLLLISFQCWTKSFFGFWQIFALTFFAFTSSIKLFCHSNVKKTNKTTVFLFFLFLIFASFFPEIDLHA